EEHLHVNARTVALAAEAGVPLARAIIQNAAEAIGVGLVNIIHCFNPEIIILGGGVTQMGPMLMEPAQRVVQERAMKFPRESVRIVQAQLGHNVGLIGAGALIYYHKNIKIKI
ncbi:MAG: ROK family protein, partial [Chloroflexi bacterium]